MSALGLFFLLMTPVFAQYPGKVAKGTKADPVLRSVAVLEWTGEAGKPAASRLVPVSVFDGEALNDGTIYLSRPEPLALSSGVEYELQTAGKPVGVYDVFGAGEADGAWRGFGRWKPLSAVEAEKAKNAFNTSSLNAPVDLPEDDKPVLKRKHPKGTDTDEAGTGSDAKAGESAGKKEPDDPDRPKLKKKSEDTTASDDPDRPTIRRKAGDSGDAGEGGGTGSVDPDRPTIRRSRHAEEPDLEAASTAAPDPDRPRLKRGKPADYETAADTPKLEGTPPNLQQAVAVSDARTLAEHPWKYSWANPEDEAKMKSALEAIARTELGLDAPVKPAVKAPARKGTTAVAAKRPGKSMLPAAEPAALGDEKFQVFELAYGATATIVLTASTPEDSVSPPSFAKDSGSVPKSSVNVKDGARPDGTPAKDADAPVIRRGKPVGQTQAEAAGSADVKSKVSAGKVGASKTGKDGTDSGIVKPKPRKFVTLIAQPDLYGGVLVLFKSVTDSAHLDEKPRMRLVDAVDAMGDNRGELLFELRGAGERQFGLYRVNRGSAEQLFATVPIP